MKLRELGREVPPAQGRLLTVNEVADRLGLSVAWCAVIVLLGKSLPKKWAAIGPSAAGMWNALPPLRAIADGGIRNLRLARFAWPKNSKN